MKLKVINIKSDGIKCYYGGAWCLVFVYSNKGNFILRGYNNEILNFFKILTISGYKFFANIVSYKNYFSNHLNLRSSYRSKWVFYDNTVKIIPGIKHRKHRKSKNYYGKNRLHATKWKVVKNSHYLQFKRMPKKWIPEFENL